MNKSILGKIDHHIDGFFKQTFDLLLGADSLNVAKWGALNKRHDNRVSVGIDGSGSGEVVFV